MKRVNFKIVLALLAVAVLVAVLAFSALADTEKVTITYLDNGEVSTVSVDKSSTVTLPSGTESSFKGWFTKDGSFLEAGASVIASEDITFIAANGTAIAMSQSLQNSINKGYSYIKLNSNLTITSTIELKNPYLYIDLNGFTINMTTSHGFVGKDCGLIIKNGTINHTYSGADSNLVLYSLVALSPTTTADNVVLTIGAGAAVNTNCGLLEVKTDITSFSGAIDVNIMGAVSADRLVRTNGAMNGSVEFYDGSSYETECEYFFDDYSANKKGTFITLTIGQADFKLDRTTGYAKDTDRYKAILLVGKKSTYSKNVASFFPAGNYEFLKKSDTLYEFSKCNHSGPVINDPSTDCTSAVTVTHKCSYCDTEYTVDHPDGKGHTYEVALTQDLINTEEVTREGYYTYTCKICGDSYRKYIYPDPRTVYVTVGIINSNGKYEEIRVASEDIFTYHIDENKESDAYGMLTLMTFATTFMEEKFKVTQENIIYLEIPLGTEAIYGDHKNGAGSGAFMRNEHLKKISIPRSLKCVQQYAFNSMPNLESIVGLENISSSIGTRAFEQASDSKLYIEHLTLNAGTIGEASLKNVRMKTLTFGANVKTIKSSAFQLDKQASALVEIIVEGYLTPSIDPETGLEKPRTAKEIFESIVRKSYDKTNQQFANMEIFYSAHSYVTKEKVSTCTEAGYKEDICTRCSLIRDNLRYDVVPALEHTYDLTAVYDKNQGYDSRLIELVPSSCRVRGYWTHKCTVCGYADVENKTTLPYDYNAHVYTASEKIFCAGYICEVNYYTLGVCACGAVEADIASNRIYHDPVSPNGIHEWDTKNVTVIQQANCGVGGTEVQTCKICSKTKNVYVMPTGTHRYGEAEVTVPGNCQVNGTGVKTCTVCGNKRETSVPGQHVLEGEGVVIVEATTESKGQRQFFCTVCQKEIIEEIPRLESTGDSGLEAGIIALIVIGSILLVALIGLAVFFTIFWPIIKKKRNTGYTYKFNTLGK